MFGSQIAGADQQHVDAGHRRDGIGVGDGLRRLEHHDDEHRRVDRRRQLAPFRRAEAELRQRARDRAVADGRIAQRPTMARASSGVLT